MAKDAHDDPYEIGGDHRVMLVCADCGELAELGGTRRDRKHQTGDIDQAAEPLCIACYPIAERIWGTKNPEVRLEPVGPAVIIHPDTGERAVRRACPRCNGTGTVYPFGYCYTCRGNRWTYVYPASIRRVARWWQTYQQNRTPDGETDPAQPDS